MTRLTAALTAALTLSASAGLAQDVTLEMMREVMAPGQCSQPFKSKAHEMPGITVHEVSCRDTAHDMLSVLVAETEDGWLPLYFADPSFQLRSDAEGRLMAPRGGAPVITTSGLVSSPVFATGTNRIDLTHRIAPGLGEGHLIHRYVVDEYGPRLIRAELSQDGYPPVSLWPYESSPLNEMGASFDLDGFTVQPTPDWVLSDPSRIADHFELDFPSVEEGRPRLEVALLQHGDRITANVVNRGWPDDSVSGVAYRVLMEQQGENWAVTGLGRAQVCSRGDKVVTAGSCP